MLKNINTKLRVKERRFRSLLPESIYENFIKEISPNDVMYKFDEIYYFYWGKWALDCVQRTLNKVGKEDVKDILDLPCGHGRVLRFFKSAFPKANLTACEIDQDGVDFCVRTFGAKGVYSNVDPTKIEISEKFDLIWCGSLLTHLDQDKWYSFIDFFSKHLEKDGILIFTAHGECIIKYLRKGKERLGLDSKRVKKILEDYDSNGFGYSNYLGNENYGISLSSSKWVFDVLSNFPQMELIEHNLQGWGSKKYHQDSYAFIRKG